MNPIMSRAEAADLVVAARTRGGVRWQEIADAVGAPLVWTTSALLGQHPMSAEQAAAACELLDLDEHVAESLCSQPCRGSDPALAQDPTVYRFAEAPWSTAPL